MIFGEGRTNFENDDDDEIGKLCHDTSCCEFVSQ